MLMGFWERCQTNYTFKKGTSIWLLFIKKEGNEILIPEKEDGKEREVDGEMKEEVWRDPARVWVLLKLSELLLPVSRVREAKGGLLVMADNEIVISLCVSDGTSALENRPYQPLSRITHVQGEPHARSVIYLCTCVKMWIEQWIERQGCKGVGSGPGLWWSWNRNH